MSENRKPICLARMSGEGLEEKYVKEVVALSAGTAAVHLALYSEEQHHRHDVTPGMSGIDNVRVKSETGTSQTEGKVLGCSESEPDLQEAAA